MYSISVLTALILCIFIASASCSGRDDRINIQSHISLDHNENLLSLHANAEDFVDSTFVLFVKISDKQPPLDAHMESLTQALAHDDCILLYSVVEPHDLLYRVYCHDKSIDSSVSDDEITPDMLLNTTLSDYLYRFFERESVTVERNQIVRRPHFFYGNEHTLQYAMLLDAMGGNNTQVGSASMMMPSSETMERLRALNYIAMNVGWGLDRIDQRAGILDQRYNYILNTPDVDIYVIDTGIRVSHADFDGRAIFLINTVGDGIDTDMAGHGTFCASEVAGKTYGVAKNARLYGVKVLDSLGDGDLFTIQAGILQVLKTSRLNTSRRAVASMSLGGTKSTLIDNAVASLTQNNIVAVVSAGNAGADACLYSPSGMGGVSSANVITVGATDVNDFRPTWSNYGRCVSISAPGAAITAAWITGDTSTRILSGTSMAAPLVAGTAALVLQQNPGLSVSEAKDLILTWATPNIVDYASITGGGKNLLYSLIDISVAVTPSPPPPPSPILITLPSNNAKRHTTEAKLSLLLALLSIVLVMM